MIRLSIIIVLLATVQYASAQSDINVISYNYDNYEKPDVAAESHDSTSVKTKTLDEVVVKSSNVVSKGDTLMLFPTKRDKRFASDGIDVIRNMNIPELSVDPMTNALTTSGGESVATYIDYQPASAQQLRNVRPQDIERIDFLRYPADPRFNNAPFVVNYIMKKYLYGGYSKADVNQLFPMRRGDYYLYSKLSYKKMTYDVYGGTSWLRYGSDSGYESLERYRFTTGDLQRRSYTTGYKRHELEPSVTGRAIYDTGKISIANSVGFNYSRVNPFRTTSVVDYSDGRDPQVSHRSANSTNKSVVWEGDYYFQLPGNSSLNFSGNFKWGENSDNSTYMLGTDSPIVNDISEQIHRTDLSLSYSKPLGKQSVSVSLSGGWNRNRLRYTSSDPSEVVHSEGYGQLGLGAKLRFGIVSFDPGLRICYSEERLNGRKYGRWFPKSFIPVFVRINGQQSFNGSFEYFVGCSSASYMSPILVRNDEINAIRGNADLKDFNSYYVTAAYSNYFGDWLRMRINASFNYQDNLLVPRYTEEMSASGEPMMVRDVFSHGSRTQVNLRLTLSGQYFGRRLLASVTVGGRYYRERSFQDRDKFAPDFNVGASWYMGDFRIGAFYRIPGKYYSAWGDSRNPAYFYVSGSWSWKDLYVDLRLSNPFRKSYVSGRSEYNSPDYSMNSTSQSFNYHQFVQLTVSYSLSYGKKLDRRDEVNTMNGAGSIILK